MNIVQEKWEEIIEHLKVEHDLSNVSFTTWIRPLKVYDVIDDTVIILVNTNSSVEYIEKKYLLPLKVMYRRISQAKNMKSVLYRKMIMFWKSSRANLLNP